MANEDYYGGAPAIENVTIVFMSEDAALAAVQAGQVDVAYTSATLAQEVPGYRIEAIRSADNRGFTLPMEPNTGKTAASGAPIGNDVTCSLEVRQAIAYAIDRQAIADAVLHGYGRPAYSENDGMPWNNPEVAIETDVEYAKQLLADAGWADGDGDGILEAGRRARLLLLPVPGGRLRAPGRGHGRGRAGAQDRHRDRRRGHQLGRHRPAHVLRGGDDGLGLLQPERDVLPLPLRGRVPGRLLQPGGLRQSRPRTPTSTRPWRP